MQRCCLDALPGINEPINYDDFEAFTGTQFHPCGIGTSVGSNSWFVYTLGFAPASRRWFSSPTTWRPTRAIRRHPRGAEVRHLVFPNPKRGPKGSRRSPQARTRDAAMFPTDALHSFTRHSIKMHVRETIAFGRRTEAQLERMYILAVFRNLVKRRSERKAGSVTPAMWLGLTDSRWSWERVFAQRLQPSRVTGGIAWPELYDRRMTTPTLARTPAHQLKLAY